MSSLPTSPIPTSPTSMPLPSGGSVAPNAVPGVSPPAAPAPATRDSSDRTTRQQTDAGILIVDDEPINIKVVQKFLQGAGYTNFSTTNDSRLALDLVRSESPDVVLLDIMMPHVSGLEILEAMRADDDLRFVPVLILTASSDAETKLKALQLGATDFLSKPVDASELVLRLGNTLVVKSHQDHLASYSEQLEREVDLRTAELATSRREIVHALARAGEYRDTDTGHHVIRVGKYVGIVANELGLDAKTVELMELAALLHDVGKIGISDLILLKPARLEPEEIEIMKKHCEYGSRIIQPGFDAGPQAFLPGAGPGPSSSSGKRAIASMAASIAWSHHEQWDGSGYPRGLAGEQIPLEGRITAVADVYDALSSKRPYKEPIPTEKCFEMLEEQRGSHFDPRVLDAFFARRADILRIQEEYSDDV